MSDNCNWCGREKSHDINERKTKCIAEGGHQCLLTTISRLRGLVEKYQWAAVTKSGLQQCPCCRLLGGDGASHTPDCEIGKVVKEIKL